MAQDFLGPEHHAGLAEWCTVTAFGFGSWLESSPFSEATQAMVRWRQILAASVLTLSCHGVATGILAGACGQLDERVQWYSLGDGYSGQAIGNGINDILPAVGPVGSILMDVKVYEGFSFEGGWHASRPKRKQL